jgi:zinc transporter ZupT
MVRAYWTIWAIFAFVGAVVFASGNFTNLMAVVFGFIAFGMVFMGMISVLPSMVSHPASAKHPAEAAPVERPQESTAPAANGAFGVLKSA